MNRYEKPLVAVSFDYAEGIFAASGETMMDDPISFVITQSNAWEGNRQYDITLTNSSDKDVELAVIEVPVRGNVSYVGGNWDSVELMAGSVILTFSNWGNGIRAGGAVTVYTHVMGDGDFSLG